MSVTFSTILSLAPVIAIVAVSALIAFVLARQTLTRPAGTKPAPRGRSSGDRARAF